MIDWYGSNETLIQLALTAVLLGYSVQVALRAGVFSLAGIGFYGIAGYTAGNLVKDGMSGPLAILIGVAVCLPFAYILALILGRLRSLYLAMSTVAFDLIVVTVALKWDAFTGGAGGLFAIPLASSTVSIAAVVLVVTAFLAWRERGARGRVDEVMRLDESLARTLGNDIKRRRATAFVLSCALGGLAGAHDALLFSTMLPEKLGFAAIITVLTMVVIGGAYTWSGVIIGAVIVTWLPEVLRFGGQWRELFYGAIVILVVLYAPDGLAGIVRDLWRKVRPRLRRTAAVEAAA